MPLLRVLLTRRWMIAIGLGYIIVGLVSRFYGYHQEDAAWFSHMANQILNGSFRLYDQRAQPWAAPPAGMAFTYPPLLPIILIPFVAVGRMLGLSLRQVEVLIGLPWLVCDVMLAGQIIMLAKKWTGYSDARWQIVTFLLCLLTFIVPFSSAYMGHHESFILLMILLALRTADLSTADLYWGLALAAKQTAGFALLPVAFLVLSHAWQTAKPRLSSLAAFFLPLVGVPAALILPFWLQWPAEVSYSLLGVERYRILYGTNLPHLLERMTARLVPELQPTVNAFLIRWSSPFFLLAISVFSMILALRQIRLEPAGKQEMALWQKPPTRKLLIAAMGANTTAFLVLGKWTETHYQFIPLMLLLILNLLERPDYPYVYILFVFAGMLFYVFSDPLSAYWRLAVSIALTRYFVARAWHLSVAASPMAGAGR